MNQVVSPSIADSCSKLQQNLSQVILRLEELDWVWESFQSPFDGLYIQSQELFRDVLISPASCVSVCELVQSVLCLKNIKPISEIFPNGDEFIKLKNRVNELSAHHLNLKIASSENVPDSDEHFYPLIQDRLGSVCRKLTGFLSNENKGLVHVLSPYSFAIAWKLWKKIDLNLFEMSSALTLIASEDAFSSTKFPISASGKVLWTERVIQNLEKAKEEISQSILKKVASLFGLTESSLSDSQILSQIDVLINQENRYKSVLIVWNEFKKAFGIKPVGEVHVLFVQLKTQVSGLSPVQKPIEENKGDSNGSSSITGVDDFQIRASKCAVHLLHRSRDEGRMNVQPQFSSLSTLDLIPEILSGLPLEAQIRILNRSKEEWALSTFKMIVSDSLAPAVIYCLLNRAIREKNIEAQRLFLQPGIYLVLLEHYSSYTKKWIENGDEILKKELAKFAEELNQAV